LLGSFTCRKAGTWDRCFYFPSEGRHAEDFYTRKNPTVSAGFEPANSGTGGQHANHDIAVSSYIKTKLILINNISHKRISFVIATFYRLSVEYFPSCGK
jgi:hypothetical protein